MQGKLRQLMKHEGINSTRLAEILGIQASGISHIMSGRNKPSFDFLLKLLQRFPQINPDWLLLDKGPMYRDEIKQKSGVGNSSRPRGAAGANGFGTSAVGAGSADSIGIIGGTGASGGLFGPDNNDIISAGGFPGDYSAGYPEGHQGAQTEDRDRQAASSNMPTNSMPNSPQTMQHGQQQVQQKNQLQTAQQTAQPAVYQSGGFKKSASIERIVVFYKDKTFSEYQPE